MDSLLSDIYRMKLQLSSRKSHRLYFIFCCCHVFYCLLSVLGRRLDVSQTTVENTHSENLVLPVSEIYHRTGVATRLTLFWFVCVCARECVGLLPKRSR